MTSEVPDDVRSAEVLLAEQLAHTVSPADTAAYLHCVAAEIATWKAAYVAARARGAAGDADALKAADEWHHLTVVAGAVLDDLKSTERWQRQRDLRGSTVVAWRDDA